jgi:predicted phage terminase large subunit-like protein
MASFEAMGSEIFKEEWVVFEESPPQIGEYYIAIDMAGFEEVGKAKSKSNKLDNTAISVVKVNEDNWYVEDIIYGRWTFEETANNIFNAVAKYDPISVGIEKGISRQAIMSPLTDMMKKRGKFFRVVELTHGNRKKTDRIVASLQGRFEHGTIKLAEGKWNAEFLDELFQFPSPLVHDDLIDSLSYISQLAVITYHYDFEEDEYEPIDIISGY